jgi:hypothetical protein
MKLKFIGIFFMFAGLLSGQTWTGNVSSNVSNSSNWVGGVPSNNSNVTFGSSASNVVTFDWPTHIRYSIGDLTFGSNSISHTINSTTEDFLTVRDIYNFSSNTQVFDINLDFRNNSTVQSESEILFNKNLYIQTGNGNLTFAGSGGISFGTETQLENITNLKLSDGVNLNLGGAVLNFNSLIVEGPSIIDFSNTSVVNINQLLFSGDGSLTILNWSEGDIFIVDTELSSENLSKVTFVDFPGGAIWDNGNVAPIPELNGSWLVVVIAIISISRRKKR